MPWFVFLVLLAFAAEVDCRCAANVAIPTNYKVLTDHLEYEYPPGSGFKPIFVKSVGYSPAPPTFSRDKKPYGDFYTTTYSYLYKRDLPVIRDMGANAIRLWQWNYMSSEVHHHADFLDACWNNNVKPLRVFIPFDMGARDSTNKLVYSNLGDGEVRRTCLSDWATLIEQYWHHPAILSWLIGNELDITFGGSLDELFSLANLMVQVAKEITEGGVQPITMPLSETNFITVVKRYADWSFLSYWSLQTYDSYTRTPHTYLNATKFTHQSLKPLMITEFGHDSIQVKYDRGEFAPIKLVNETYQTEQVLNFADRLKKFPIVAGYSLMEFLDEWWKSSVDYQNPECPNRRTDIHTMCANWIQKGGAKQEDIAIHEQWLGLFAQTLPTRTRSATKYCIQPKKVYFALAKLWGGETISGDRCSYQRYPDPIIFMVGPMLCAFICEIIYLLYFRLSGRKTDDTRTTFQNKLTLPGGMSSAVDSPHPETHDPDMWKDVPTRDMMAHFTSIQDRVRAAFEPYQPLHVADGDSPDIYGCCIRRMSIAIWDHFASFDIAQQPDITPEELENRAIRIVYIKQMEGYYIWKQQGQPKSDGSVHAPGLGHPEPTTAEGMLEDLALYDIVRLYAGTINHCPEKIMEVLYYTQNYLANCRGAALNLTRRNMHCLMRELFRIIYCYIAARVTLDDINADAVQFRSHPIPFDSTDAPLQPLEEETLRSSFTPDRYKQLLKQVQQYRYVSEPPLSGFTATYFAWVDPSSKGKSRQERSQPPRIAMPSVASSELSRTPTTRLLYGSEATAHSVTSSTSHAPVETPRQEPSPAHGVCIPDMKRAFTQRGGFPTTFYNTGWVTRLVVWIAIAAWYFQPAYPYTPVCLPDARAFLAMLDSSLKLVLELCHLRIFFTRLITFKLVLGFLYRLCAAAAIYFAFADYMRSSSKLPTIPTVGVSGLSVQLDLFGVYLAFEFTKGVIIECAHFGRTYAYALPGRIFKNSKKFFEGVAIGGAIGCIGSVIGCFLFQISAELAVGAIIGGTLASALAVAIPYSKMFGWKEATMREARYLIHNTCFWGTIWIATFFVFYQWIIPVVIKVRPDTLCICPDEKIALTKELLKRCMFGSRLLCGTAVVMVWLSVIVINFVWVFACFQLMLLVYGVGRGKRDRVGNVKTWSDVQHHFLRIKTQCFPALSQSLLSKHNQMLLWNWFIKSLYEDWLLDYDEHLQLQITHRPLDKDEVVKWELDEVERGVKYSNPLFIRPPRNQEAYRRIIYFLWSLQAIRARNATVEREEGVDKTYYRRANRVLAMPALTILTPCAAEPVIYTAQELCNPYHKGDPHSGRHPRIPALEYLQSIYPDEWENFANWLKRYLKENKDLGAHPALLRQTHLQLMQMFLEGDQRVMSNDFVVLQIRLWSSFHGQTLVRLIKGVMQWRYGLELLASLENESLPPPARLGEDQLAQVCAMKFQFVIAHQLYGSKAAVQQSKDVDTLFGNPNLGLHRWDLVYLDDNNKYRSLCRRWQDEVLLQVDRPGPLRPNDPFPTEPKAENQNHAIPFTMGQVIGVMDMNQCASLEDSFKLPFLTQHYFLPSVRMLEKPFGTKDILANDIIPPYRVVGFGEWQYTRDLSMVGEVAGQAEYCFTTIHQRVCRWPLRARLHYGHPDFMDGHWVRSRGGLSHANHLVNTAEDVFLGYEVVGRGERVEYVEWLQVQKGKESAIGPAFLFEKKLAQAAAQQLRSRDIYFLNQTSNPYTKMGMFFGCYGFFIYNTLMAMSIHLYIMAMVFFVLSGVTNHDLGINQSSLAVPWLFQVGFLFSFPLIVEGSIQKGIVFSILHFVKTLPFGILYHLFQLQTKGAYFIEGLVRGKGGYIASQRGFGLDHLTFVEIYTTYASSHIHPSINLLGWVFLYGTYSNLIWAEIWLRTLFMILVVLCWIGAPIIYNPYPSMDHLTQDLTEMITWLRNPLPTTKEIAFLLFEEHKRKDVAQGKSSAKVEVTTKTLRAWVTTQREKSWMGWYMNEVLLGPWGDEEMWFSIMGLLFQKGVLGFIAYAPWIMFTYWACPSFSASLWYGVPLLLYIVFFGIMNIGLGHLHEYFNILKLYIPALAVTAALYYLYNWRVKTVEVFFNTLFYFLLYAMAVDFCISGWNFYVKVRSWWRRSKITAKGLVTPMSTQQDEDALWFDRLAVPRFLFDIQRVYPLIAMCLFTIINALLCLCSGSLTAVLFSPAVAQAWERAASKAVAPKSSPNQLRNPMSPTTSKSSSAATAGAGARK